MTLEPERRSDEPTEAISVARRSFANRSSEIPIFFFVLLGLAIITSEKILLTFPLLRPPSLSSKKSSNFLEHTP